MKKQILQWLDERDSCLEANDMVQADALENKIFAIIKQRSNEFECDFILETLTRFGVAPSLIYDDNGKWAVLSDGTQPVVSGDEVFEGHIGMTFFCDREQWCSTIREAIVCYLNNK